ncbi:kinase-like protein [Trametes versicolor FP-101664 SS1]|uniref:kinase-like protein n=1 Tax=Trametes versicolor (strain FP-101664) TaxID=717944 RepID=UPI0004622F9F|nr:kinase-like protein [Trametes versicolor FP-101664 SS1]EIW56346.1 kinase-like protein [Trametes versicolor FP-101664 SS1]
MASTLTLEQVKALLRDSTNLNPDPLGMNMGSVQSHSGPYELNPRGTPREVRSTVYDGVPIVVKFGLEVYLREAEAMTYVASRTSIPIPRIYGVFTEAVRNGTITYIVQEQVPGTRLEHAFESLSSSERVVISRQLQDVFAQLCGLTDGRTQLGPFGGGSWARTFWFKGFQTDFPMGDADAHTTRSLLAYFIGISSRSIPGCDWTRDEFLAFFDLGRAPNFSHGDLTPWNIMVHNGRISGVVDWAEAGWYPYFWDSFVLERAASTFRRIPGVREMLRAALLEYLPEGDKFGTHWNVQSDFYW